MIRHGYARFTLYNPVGRSHTGNKSVSTARKLQLESPVLVAARKMDRQGNCASCTGARDNSWETSFCSRIKSSSHSVGVAYHRVQIVLLLLAASDMKKT